MKRMAVVMVALALAGCSHKGDDREQALAQQVTDLQQENDDLRTKLQAAEARAQQAEQDESIASSRSAARAATPDNSDNGDDPNVDPTRGAPSLSAAERAAQAASDAAQDDGPGH